MPRTRPLRLGLFAATLALALIVQPVLQIGTANAIPGSTCVPSASPFGYGAGTSGDPWLICSRSQLEAIDDSAGNLSAFYKLAADIDLGGSATPWTPLTGSFTGSFDGGYFTIEAGAYTATNIVNVGLFSVLGTGATVSKLKLNNFSFSTTKTDAETTIGIVAGLYSGAVNLTEIWVTNSSIGGSAQYAGLLVGCGRMSGDALTVDLARIESSSLVSNSTSRMSIGGIAGCVRDAVISRASVSSTTIENTTTTAQTYDNEGGMIGETILGGSVTLSKSQAAVTLRRLEVGGMKIGAVVGDGNGTLSISDFFSAGSITTANGSNAMVNGFIGYGGFSGNNLIMATNLDSVASSEAAFGDSRSTFSLTQSLFLKNSGGINSAVASNTGASAKTTAELQTKATYSDPSWKIEDTGLVTGLAAVTTNWSLDDTSDPVWRIADGSSLPSLVWQDFWPTVKVSQPGALGATSPSTGSANLSWNQSSATGFTGGVSGYKIESSTNSGGSWVTEVADTGTTATTAALTGLSAGSSYIFRVSAIASGVVSSPSAQTTTALLMGTSPGAPVNLSKTFTGSNSATVSWDAPISDGGTAVTGYRAQLDTGSGFSDVAVSGRTSLITGVSLQSTWSFRVLAENIVGDSAYATISNAPPAPYSGPIIMSVSDSQLSSPAGKSLRISGQRLSGTSSLTVDGKALTIISKSDNMIEVMLPELSPGSKNIILVSSSGVLTHQDAFEVIEQQLALVSEGLGKVNVGSFNGKLVVYALGLDRARITWKVSGIWGQDFAAGNTLNRFDRLTPLKGVTVKVDIFVDGVKRMTKNVLTR